MQKKISILFFALTIIQMTIIGFYIIYVMVDFSSKETESSLKFRAVQMGSAVDRINEKIESYTAMIRKNDEICSILQSGNWDKTDYYTSKASAKLDNELVLLMDNYDDAKACIVFSDTAPYLFSKKNDLYLPEETMFKLKDKISAHEGRIIWLDEMPINTSDGEEHYLAVGRTIKRYDKTQLINICDIIFLFKTSDFIPSDFDTENNNNVLITYTNSDELVYSTVDVSEAAAIRNDCGDILNTGQCKVINFDGGIMNVTEAIAPLTGWKVICGSKIKGVPGDILQIVIVMFLVSFVSLGIINVVFNYEFKRVFKPIKDIVNAMNEIGKNNFDIHLNSGQSGELKIICDGINKMSGELDELFKKTVMIEKQKKAEQIRALQYQMNPHFLYNTLASMKMLAIKSGVPVMAENIEALSRLLRNTVSKADELVTLEYEAANLRDYISLQQFRYNNGIEAIVEIDENAKNTLIPNLLIQPFAENAIMHGLSEKINQNEFALLKIEAKRYDDTVEIIVFDNGVGMDENKNIESFTKSGRGHVGIKNARDRIALVFGERFGVDITSKKGKFTKVRITLPYVENSNDI